LAASLVVRQRGGLAPEEITVALVLRLDLNDLTFNDLYRFTDLARAAGIPGGQKVEQEHYNGDESLPVEFVADLGDVDNLIRPVLVDGADAARYGVMLSRMLAQQSWPADESEMSTLVDVLLGNEPTSEDE